VDAEGEAAGCRGGVADFAEEEIVLKLEFHQGPDGERAGGMDASAVA
jgi:hypothetical protein